MTGLITVAQGLIACFWNRNEVRYDASRPEAAKFDPADKLNQPIIQSMVDGLGYDVAKGPIRVSEATAQGRARRGTGQRCSMSEPRQGRHSVAWGVSPGDS